MTTTQLTTSRLAVIVTAAAVVVAVLVAAFAFSGGGGPDSPARDAAERKAQDTAETSCSLEDVVTGMTGIGDPAYRACVKPRASEDMATWDARH